MKKILTVTLIVLAILLVLLAGVSCKKKGAAVLRIGTNAEYPPFEYKENDQFMGVDMDLARALAAKLGMEYSIIDMDFDALIPSLTSNKIDLALSAITITEDRMQQVDFSHPYYIANQVIIATQDSKLKVEKIEDIVKYKVGAQNGTTGQIYVQENLVDTKKMDKNNLKKYSTNIEAITDMLNGNIDFVIIDDSAAQGYAKLKPLQMLLKIETNEEYGIALQKESPYKDLINNALQEMIQSGEMIDIIAKNFAE
ncbi:MAG: transporter substrate-binding domain-containing protein [Candidatus Cloacimonadaceae bacterium]